MAEENSLDRLCEIAWKYAGRYLNSLFEKHNAGVEERFAQLHWIKTELTRPSFEHFTFGYKNAVFPVVVNLIVDGRSLVPQEAVNKLCAVSLRNNLVPCLYDMVCVRGENGAGLGLKPAADGWNLRHARSGNAVDPLEFGKDFDTKMSEWELMNFAVGVVLEYGVEKEGHAVDAFCDMPGIAPQIWFHDKAGRRSWILVKFQHNYDESEADSFRDFARGNPRLAAFDGYFAPVSAAMADAVVKDHNEKVVPLSRRFDGTAPLYRGHGMCVNFRRLIKINDGNSSSPSANP